MQWTNKHVSENVVDGDGFPSYCRYVTHATHARRFVNSDTWD